MLQHQPVIPGLEHLAAIAARPVVIVANHLSYADANAIDVLLQQAGADALCERLTVVAGPKVYLLIFPEGTRSRTARMQPLLAGIARYLESPDVWILPVGITGTERLFPIGEDALNPVPITLRIGAPIAAHALSKTARGDRQLMMDTIGAAIAKLLPVAYRGAYLDEEADFRVQDSN